MRTLLYFTLNDVATARLAQARLGELFNRSELVGGPWFVQGDDQPVEGLPRTELSQTTYREETAIGGFVVGVIAAVPVILAYGVPAGPAASVVAFVGGLMFGGMIGWWIGGLVGARIRRFGLASKKLRLRPGKMLMVVSGESQSKDLMKRTIQELGGVNVDEHNDLLPNFRWL